MSDKLGGGSLTALPIIETQAGDVSAYIPTNVISITDGQIFLETDLFNSGVRPAVNVGLSVSRVGFAAAVKATKQVGATLKLDLAQYRELAAFSQFGSDLDKVTQNQLNRGARLVELLKQPQFQPLSMEKQAAILFAGVNGLVDDVEVKDLRAFEDGFYPYLESQAPTVLTDIATKKALDDDLKKRLTDAIKEYKGGFLAGLKDKATQASAGSGGHQVNHGKRSRSTASHPQCEEHAADHQGHEDGLGCQGCGARRSVPCRRGPTRR